MAKKKAAKGAAKPAKKETKSEFLRRALGRNPDLAYDQVNRRWAKAGNVGTISSALFYRVRSELGVKTDWTWVPPAPPTPAVVDQFKVTLLEVEPPVWRRIQVADGTLDALHAHIQTAFGWTNSHLHHFRIDGRLYGDPLLMAGNFGDMGYADSTKTLLSDVLPADGRRFAFEYEYDFGDGWVHEVLFEGRPRVEPKARYPLCLEGARACPPEDVGGPWGYADFLDALSDPDNDPHDEFLDWAGGAFDPESFNPSAATARMRKGLSDWRRHR